MGRERAQVGSTTRTCAKMGRRSLCPLRLSWRDSRCRQTGSPGLPAQGVGAGRYGILPRLYQIEAGARSE